MGGILVIVFLFWQVERAYTALLGSEKPIDAVLKEVESRRTMLFGNEEMIEEQQDVIHVLLLGLDARKGWDSPHCDAIHMFTLHTRDWTIDITSVPRGTYAPLPPGHQYEPTDYYISNACGFGGLEYGIDQIEKIIGVKADYYVTVGFSQVYGILRTFELPTTQSLQWLRHRQSYAIGDPQRSHNQAIFMKDLVLQQGYRLEQPTATTLMFILYNMLDTNMDFGTARALLKGYLASDIVHRPEDIRLSMKPFFPVEDYHFDFENPDPQIEALLARIRPYLSKEDLSDRELEDYQKEILAFLEEELESKEGIEGIMNKELWLQIEDNELRKQYHFRYLEAYVVELIAQDERGRARDEISDVILEYTALEDDVMVARTQELLRRVLQ